MKQSDLKSQIVCDTPQGAFSVILVIDWLVVYSSLHAYTDHQFCC